MLGTARELDFLSPISLFLSSSLNPKRVIVPYLLLKPVTLLPASSLSAYSSASYLNEKMNAIKRECLYNLYHRTYPFTCLHATCSISPLFTYECSYLCSYQPCHLSTGSHFFSSTPGQCPSNSLCSILYYQFFPSTGLFPSAKHRKMLPTKTQKQKTFSTPYLPHAITPCLHNPYI